MSKRIADLTCPECKKSIQIPFELQEPPTLDEISNSLKEAVKGQPEQFQKVLQEQLEKLKPPEADEAHKHKTFDELFDCPGCSKWIKETATKYNIAPKEPAPKEPAPVGSIFSTKTEE